MEGCRSLKSEAQKIIGYTESKISTCNTIISEASFLCFGEKTRADPDLISKFSSFNDLANKARSNLEQSGSNYYAMLM